MTVRQCPISDLVPIDKAEVVRDGSDITLVGWASTLHLALDAAELLAVENGISADVIDLRTLSPIDMETILASVRKTGRLLVVDEDYLFCGLSGEIIAAVTERAFGDLRATPGRIAYPNVPPPFAPELERHVLPSAAKIVAAVRAMVRP